MIKTYFGEYNTAAELEEYKKQSKINEYKKYSKIFNSHPTIEISSILSDLSLVLVNRFSLTWEEIEQLER